MNKIEQKLNLLERQLHSQDNTFSSPLWRIANTIDHLAQNVDKMSSTEKNTFRDLCPKVDIAIEKSLEKPKHFAFIQNLFRKIFHYESIPSKLENLKNLVSLSIKAVSIREAEIFKKAKPDRHADPITRLEKAFAVAKAINEKPEDKRTARARPYFREPITNLEKVKGLTAPEQKFARLVSYERFSAALRRTFSSTLSSIIAESPKEPPPYVVIADRGDKSTNWVTSQVLDLMEKHPPVALVRKRTLSSYLKDHPEVKHAIMIDDGSYSGEQASKYTSELKLEHFPENRKLHVCIPYMTSFAKKRIESAGGNLGDGGVKFHEHQIMHTYKEMQDAGYFGYTQMQRPDVKHLLTVKPLETSDPHSDDQIKEVNKQIALLQENIFKKTDEQIHKALNEVLSSLPKDDAFKEIRKDLLLVQAGIKRAGVDPNLSTKNVQDYNRENNLVDSITPLWMAHKSADNTSTDLPSMRRATKAAAVEPYKEDLFPKRDLLISELQTTEKKKNGSTLNERYTPHRLGKEQIVVSNRGCFLLADNYCLKPDNDAYKLTLTIDGHKFPFGGQDGLFQYKLTEGLVFSLEKPGEAPRTFKYADGKITRM